MADFTDRINALSPEKRRLLETLLLREEHNGHRDRAPYVAPQTPAECALTSIWEEVLGLKQIGVNDNFFELGGDSIQCIQIAAKARQSGILLTTNNSSNTQRWRGWPPWFKQACRLQSSRVL